jgi:superfamily I DNA/RNA helicase
MCEYFTKVEEMAIIYEGSTNIINNEEKQIFQLNQSGKEAEIQVCEMIRNSIDKDVFGDEVYGKREATIGGLSSDLLLVIPNYGIVVVEIKAFSRSFIKDYTDEDIIITTDDKRHRHPYDQANDYVRAIRGKLRAEEFVENMIVPGKDFCNIVGMVAMPNMSDNEVYDLALDTKCDLERMITKDWFVSDSEFRKRFQKGIKCCFNRVKKISFKKESYDIALTLVSNKHLREARRLYTFASSKYTIDKTEYEENIECAQNRYTYEDLKNFTNTDCYLNKDKIENWDYSHLYLLANLKSSEFKHLLEKALFDRTQGTKLIFLFYGSDESNKIEIYRCIQNILCDDSDIYNELEKILKQNFVKCSWSTFLFEIHFIGNQENMFAEDDILLDGLCKKDGIHTFIKNGEKVIKIKKKIEFGSADKNEEIIWEIINTFNESTDFNLEQYLVEHYDTSENLIITAGAGTGKTFSMLGRVSFLVHNNIISEYINKGSLDGLSNRLSEMIYMMTFTNNSTDEMRDRLGKHYEKYYSVTNKIIYMLLIKEINKMPIKTIDSMSKMLLAKYAYLLGMTSNLTITSGIFRLRHIIRNNVQDSFNNTSRFSSWINSQNLRSYQIESYIEKIINFLSQRSLSLNYQNINLAENENHDNSFRDFLQEVIKKSEVDYRVYCESNNSIEMGSIITYLKEVKELIPEHINQSNCLRYLFIDEFQDTDNYQIEIIKHFAILFNFKLFVVGDKKQGIYGFRGADDSAFKTLEFLCAKDGVNFTTLELRKNYRTDEILLNEINQSIQNWPSLYFQYNKQNLIPQKRFHKVIRGVGDLYHQTIINNSCDLENAVIQCINKLKNNVFNDPFDNNEEVIAILTRTNQQVSIIREMSARNNWEIEFDTKDDFYQQDAIIDFYKMLCAILDKDNPVKVYSLAQTPYSSVVIPKSRFHKNDIEPIRSLEDLDRDIKDTEEHFDFMSYVNRISLTSALKLLQELVSKNKPWERYIPEDLVNDKSNICAEKWIRLDEERNYYKKCLDQLFQILVENNGTEYITVSQIKDKLEISIYSWQKMQLFSSLKQEKFREKLSLFNSLGIIDITIINEKEQVIIQCTVDELLYNEDKHKVLLDRKVEIKEYNEVDKTVIVKIKSKVRIICTTVHKSKGLEYRAVLLPFTTTDIGKMLGDCIILDNSMVNGMIEYCLKKEDSNNSSAKIFYQSLDFKDRLRHQIKNQTSEELRILYVALTRAKGELYYIVNNQEQTELNKKGKEYWAKYL